MQDNFSEIKFFQVKPDKTEAFEAMLPEMTAAQQQQPGCLHIRYVKRFYTIDGVTPGDPPRELTRVVKCVKYLSNWEFDTKENYGKAIQWYFSAYGKPVQRLLLMPFDIYCGLNVG